MLKFTFTQLISAGVHVGHSLKNTLLFASWMLFNFRQNVWFIDLFLTMHMFKLAFQILKHIVSTHGPIWFINLDKATERYVRYGANRSGEFFSSTFWIRGMLSNFYQIYRSFKKSGWKNELLKSRKYKVLDISYQNWIFTRFSRPRAIIVFSASSSALAVLEASASGIPCIAIADTNIKSQIIHLAIPGNDDSLESLIFYSEVISNFVLLCKFGFALLWCSKIRRSSRLISFEEWFKLSFKANLKSKLKIYKFYLTKYVSRATHFQPSYFDLVDNSYISYFSRGYWHNERTDFFIVLPEKIRHVIDKKVYFLLENSYRKLMSLAQIFFYKTFWVYRLFFNKRKKKIKRGLFLSRIFRSKKSDMIFFSGGFIWKFLSNRFRKLLDKNKSFKRNLCFFFLEHIKLFRLEFDEWRPRPFYGFGLINLKVKEWKPWKPKRFHRFRFIKSRLKKWKFGGLNKKKRKLKKLIKLKKIYSLFFLDAWVRIIFRQLGGRSREKVQILKDLSLLSFKRKKRHKRLLSKKKRFNLIAHGNFKFILGLSAFKNFLPSFYWIRNENLLFMRRVPWAYFWYFWHLYRPKIYFKGLHWLYKGPAFIHGIFNFFFKRRIYSFIVLKYNIFRIGISIIDFFFFHKKKNQISKKLNRLWKIDFFLTFLLDRRFDIIKGYRKYVTNKYKKIYFKRHARYITKNKIINNFIDKI